MNVPGNEGRREGGSGKKNKGFALGITSCLQLLKIAQFN